MADDIQTKAADLVKKVLTVGVGAIFLTEEGLRGLISDIKLPKELLSGVLDSAAKTKNDFLSKLSGDIMEKVTAKMDPVALAQELFEKNEIELNIKVKLHPKKAAESENVSE